MAISQRQGERSERQRRLPAHGGRYAGFGRRTDFGHRHQFYGMVRHRPHHRHGDRRSHPDLDRAFAARQPASVAGRRPDRDRQRADPERDPRCGPRNRKRPPPAHLGHQHDRERPDSPHRRPRHGTNSSAQTPNQTPARTHGNHPCHPGIRTAGRDVRRPGMQSSLLISEPECLFFGRKSEQNIVAVRIISIFTMKSSLNPNI